MEDPKKAMKIIRGVVKEYLPKFAAGEVIDGCTHFGDVVRDLYEEEDMVRLVICLQDAATSEKEKKERAGTHIINLKKQLEDCRELLTLQRQAIHSLDTNYYELHREYQGMLNKNNSLGAQLDDMTEKFQSAMTLLKEQLANE